MMNSQVKSEKILKRLLFIKDIIKRKKVSFLVVILLQANIFISTGGDSYLHSADFKSQKKASRRLPIEIPKVTDYPQNYLNMLPPFTSAQAVFIIDLPSQVVIYQKNVKKRLFPASTTKLMTVLAALDYYKRDQLLTVNKVVNQGRNMGLISGEKISAENLFYGALIHSANDAAYTLAENYPGGVAAFVQKMNQKAKETSLKETNFTNPIGFEDQEHYTTAWDLSILAKEALKNSFIRKSVGIKEITVSDDSYTFFHKLTSVNELLGKIPGVAGVKTGFTEGAGECLVSLTKRDGHEVLIVLLSSQDRFSETESLVNWVFTNFKWIDLTKDNKDI